VSSRAPIARPGIRASESNLTDSSSTIQLARSAASWNRRSERALDRADNKLEGRASRLRERGR
jgi:hypothetical protein